MIGRFWFYRRRRALPFLAAYCLVSINSATLAPLVLPDHAPTAASAPADGGCTHIRHHSSRRLRYERRHAGDTEPESVAAAGLPPIVKNLRRPAPKRHAAAVPVWHDRTCSGPRATGAGFGPRAPAANAADLTRLCRLLI